MNDSFSSTASPRWKVVVFYEEPTYALRTGTLRTYRADYEVLAASAEGAAAQGRERFNQAARESSVSWTRLIVSVEAYPVEESLAPRTRQRETKNEAAEPLCPTPQKPYAGNEPLHKAGRALPITMHDFWRWSRSDLLTHVDRGVFAEFLVATALGASQEPKDAWQPWALTTPEPEAIRVEVKSAAYLHKWRVKKRSQIYFAVAPTYGWSVETGEPEKEKRRQAQVYVFCLLTEKDPGAIDPLDLEQWDLWVLPTAVLDAQLSSRKRVSLKKLEALARRRVRYSELGGAVVEAAENPTLR